MTNSSTTGTPSCPECEQPYSTIYDGNGTHYVCLCLGPQMHQLTVNERPTVQIPPPPNTELMELVDAVKELSKQVANLVDELKDKEKTTPELLKD